MMNKRDMLINIITIIIHDRLSHNITKNQACGAAELVYDLCIQSIIKEKNINESDIKNINEYDRLED